MIRRFFAPAQWGLYVGLTFLAALFLAWHGLAQMNFLYPFWYEVIGIEEDIAIYGPENRYRHDFEVTTKAERIRLFSEMVNAIHHQGRGLETLVYHDPDGRSVATLLTRPEIVHLQDVSRLIDRLNSVGWGALLGVLVLMGLMLLQKLTMPSMRALLLTALSGVGLIVLSILLIGPVKVFYRLHTWVFPEGHPWFFYYQDSLMTTMMKAPDLFGYIALSLVLVTLGFFLVILLFTKLLLQRSQS